MRVGAMMGPKEQETKNFLTAGKLNVHFETRDCKYLSCMLPLRSFD